MFVFIFLVLHLNLPISILSLACSACVNHQPSLNNQLKRNLETVIMVFTLVYEFSCCLLFIFANFPGGSDGKASVYNAGDPGSSPGLGRSPGEGNGNPFQYYCLENPTDRGAWQAPVYGVAESRTRLSDFTSLLLSTSPNLNSFVNTKCICRYNMLKYQLIVYFLCLKISFTTCLFVAVLSAVQNL